MAVAQRECIAADVVVAIEQQGWAVIRSVIRDLQISEVLAALNSTQGDVRRQRCGAAYASRNLLAAPRIAELARSSAIRRCVEPILGSDAIAVRGILFDKVAEANWKVAWHQDLTIELFQRNETPDFGPWSVKAGICHVQAPAHVLEKILAVRIHLDDCDESNGPLRVIPGSHRSGKLTSDEIMKCRKECGAVTICVNRGDVLLMKPLLVHASSPAEVPQRRRVVHLEYTAQTLPNGLQWHVSA